MAYDDCLEAIQRAMGREVTRKEKQEIGRFVEQAIRTAERDGLPEELAVKVLRRVNEAAKVAKVEAVIKKRNTALNAKRFAEKFDRMLTHWEDAPEEGLRALLAGSNLDRPGARQSVEAHQAQLSNHYATGLLARLAEKDLLEVVNSGSFDDQIWRAMSELSNDVPQQAILRNLQPEAVQAARIFHESLETARLDANRAGAWIQRLPGWVIRRSHDHVKIGRMGFKGWRDFVAERLDWEKTMPEVFSPEAREEVLQRLWKQLSTGEHVKYDGSEGVPGLSGGFNIGEKLSRSRYLHFKSPEAEFDYQRAFGRGDTLAEGVTVGLLHMARDTALMRELGPNAEANLERLVQKWRDHYVKSDAPDSHVKLEELSQAHRKVMRTLWPVITGAISIPENASFAAWSKTIRNVEMMADLGGAVLSAIPDLAFYASVMRYGSKRSLGTFLSGMGEAAGHIVGGLTTKVTPDKMKLASEMGILLDALSPVASHFDVGDVPGGTTAMLHRFFKLNLLSPWVDRLRLGSVMATGHRHAQHAALPLAELPEGMRALFRQFGIGPEDWDVIRAGTLSTDSQGREFLTPEAVEDLASEAFDVLPSVRARKESILQKESALLQRQQEADARDLEWLQVRVEKFRARKTQAETKLREFEERKLDAAAESVDYLNHQVSLTRARLELAEIEAEIASGMKGDIQEERLRRFLESVEEGADAGRLGDRAAKGSRRYGDQAGDIGERLGIRRQRATARINELEKKAQQVEAEVFERIDARTKATAESVRKLGVEFRDYASRTRGRVDARSARVQEYRENIGRFIESAREDARTGLTARYRSLFSEIATMVTSEPGKAERALLLQGTRPGTVSGETARHLTMYKNFTASVLRRHIGRELFGYSPENMSVAKAIRRTILDPGGSSFRGVANLMAFGTALGAVAMGVKDIAKGRTPRVPQDEKDATKLMGAAMAQSGAFGIYGDFLFGEMRTRYGHSPLETIAGPTARRFVDVLDVFNRFRKGDDTAASALKVAYNTTPSLFYTRVAMDYLFLYRMMEWANPGALRRMEERVRRESGQEFLVPPSEVVGR